MLMIYNLILLTAVVNAVLGVLALTKGKSNLNRSFFILSMLLAVWNFLVVMWQGYGFPVLDRVNFAVVAFMPPAGMFFAISLFKIERGYTHVLLKIYIFMSSLLSLYAVSTFFSTAMFSMYDTVPVRLTMLGYQLITLFVVFYVLISNYLHITYKQEKTKVGYVILANLILFAGGMLDFMGGLGWHNLMYTGNLANTVYAAIIFIAIFRMRLFDSGVIFKNFLVYAGIAVIMAMAYSIMARLIPDDETPVLIAVNFMITLLVVFYIKNLHNYFFLFLEKIGGLSGSEEARRSFEMVKEMQIGEEDKIRSVLSILEKNLEMEVSFYIKEGDYYVKKLSEDTSAQDIIEAMDTPDEIIIRYETVDENKIQILDVFDAAIIIPVRYGANIVGLISGKKQTDDISFLEDEIYLLKSVAETLVLYYNTHALQQKLIEEENMKRIGLMARQMAHEIKNPLAALWGAAQLLEGESDAEKENVGIIRDEIKRLTNILDSWKDFSDELKLDRTTIDVMDLISDVIKIINLQDARVLIDFKKQGSEKFIVSADTDKMKQVFINVIINAIDAMEKVNSPSLEIYVMKKERFADIKVRDNGCGVPKELITKIKQPLVTSKAKGTGLGLAISDKIVKEHGGALIIESDGKSYTEVTVSLPLE